MGLVVTAQVDAECLQGVEYKYIVAQNEPCLRGSVGSAAALARRQNDESFSRIILFQNRSSNVWQWHRDPRYLELFFFPLLCQK